MRSNRTGRTTDNRLFRWNGRFFFTFFEGCFNGVKLRLLFRLLRGSLNSKKERQCRSFRLLIICLVDYYLSACTGAA